MLSHLPKGIDNCRHQQNMRALTRIAAEADAFDTVIHMNRLHTIPLKCERFMKQIHKREYIHSEEHVKQHLNLLFLPFANVAEINSGTTGRKALRTQAAR